MREHSRDAEAPVQDSNGEGFKEIASQEVRPVQSNQGHQQEYLPPRTFKFDKRPQYLLRFLTGPICRIRSRPTTEKPTKRLENASEPGAEYYCENPARQKALAPERDILGIDKMVMYDGGSPGIKGFGTGFLPLGFLCAARWSES